MTREPDTGYYRARLYLDAGLGVLPIRLDGSKAPDLPRGHQLLKERMSEADLWRRFNRPSPPGIGLACGRVSGNLECIDFEILSVFEDWRAIVEEQIPGLVKGLTTCLTPGHQDGRGVHVWYRVKGIAVPGSRRLAQVPTPDGKNPITIIETRGEGGYAVAPGSPRECHESGRLWEWHAGPPFTDLAVIGAADREVLIAAARSFNAWIDSKDQKTANPKPATRQHAGNGDSGLRPSDLYNQRGPDWVEILDRHGWKVASGSSGGKRYWRRPDKDRGWSATTGVCKGEDGTDLFYVFSSNAHPFEQSKAYSKFSAFVILEHGGDWSAAAKELARDPRYGTQPRTNGRQASGHHGNGHQANGHHGQNGHQKLPDDQQVEPQTWETPIPLTQAAKVDSFPLDVFPRPLEQFAAEVAWAKNCPSDYAAVPMLVVAGAAIGASRSLRIKDGWFERPSLFAAVIGPPGSTKTPALHDAATPVYTRQSRNFAHYRRQRTAWEEGDQKQPPPRLETVYVNDVTIEKLVGILRDNPRGVALIRDELTGWVASLDQYRAKGRGADRQTYLSMWAGVPIRVDRKGDQEPVYVPHPFIGVVGGLPPSLLRQLRGDTDAWDGFLDRILLSYPGPLPAKGEDWASVSQEAAEPWAATLDWLRSNLLPDTADGEERPRSVALTSDGKKAWEKFTAELAQELNKDNLPEPIQGHLAKFKGYCARLALVVHCLRQAGGETGGEDVDGESMNRASRLIAYFRSHALKVHAALGSDSEIEEAQRVLQWIEREDRESFKRWEVHKDVRNSGRFQRIESLDRPLQRLIEHGYLRRAEPESQGRGRPADPVFEVNPKHRRENRVNRGKAVPG
jgi:hypothetical protein